MKANDRKLLPADAGSVPTLRAGGECVIPPPAPVSAAVDYIKARYSSPGPLSYATGGFIAAAPAEREYVCTYCERGQCARCNDKACTCCYGNED